MEEPTVSSEVVVDIPSIFTLFKNGSVRRSSPAPPQPPSPVPATQDAVASKDVNLDTEQGLWARIFLPFSHPPEQKLALVLYFHGGAFLFGSPSWAHIHGFCAEMAKKSSTIWVSASYRLAPEHRLPAAFDDGFAALQWLHAQSLLQAEGKEELMDAWLAKADFGKCFLAGESAGSLIVHHVAVRAMENPSKWGPLCICGLVLIHTGFIRGTRTQEEIDCPPDIVVHWSLVDTLMGLALPEGASNDHPFFNPLLSIGPSEKAIFAKLPKTLVALADKDVGHYLGLAFIDTLRDAGCHVDLVMSHGLGHLFYFEQPDLDQSLHLKERISVFLRNA
ncbi:hypothetical protein L7F22_023730 [Adiantum nelumboides]|nr:hypothetical protein [Adiantum nelumboides]